MHGILQARILEQAAIPSPGDPPDPGTELASPALAGRFFTNEPPGKPLEPVDVTSFGKSVFRDVSK